ncbi:hypothetical protein [Paenibacillus gallinarum]|uniref:Uncharacterized protein n=1 Tax=Paenibacillus gallinarum TaxID=2762232 RepID=A0ABR8T7S5_9BACL|nr:hypothetical protein [Paenibacillus gallinarum]MBD7971399.1 hypothetical protein [Paenibacillus gallinarum]
MNETHDPRPVGRPSQGITKKVSLTLTIEEWTEIEDSGKTVAAFLKDKMKKQPDVTLSPESKTQRIPIFYPRPLAEECWDTYLERTDEQLPSDIIDAAKESMFQILYPNQAENVIVEVKEQYICPFTGKRFGSMDKLVSTAIPTLIQWATAKINRELERAAKREKEKK